MRATALALFAIGCAACTKSGHGDEKLCAKLQDQRSRAQSEQTVPCTSAHIDPGRPESTWSLAEHMAHGKANEPCRLAVGQSGVCGGSHCVYAGDATWVTSCTEGLLEMDRTRPEDAKCVRACIDRSATLVELNACTEQC
jgi:hypothetical protein